MNQLKTLCTRLSLVFVVVLFASAVCAAQTPPAGAQGKNEKPKAAAPDKDKPAATPTAPTVDEELAKTPAGKAVAKFFAAFNSGDVKQMRAFHESAGGNPENADKDLEMYERTGGLKLHSLTAGETKDAIAVLVQAKKDARWLTFEFTVGTDAPYPIMSISVSPAQPPAN